MEKHKISRRNALRMMGAMCAGTVLSSCTGTKVKAEEPTEKYKRLIFFFSATGNSLYIAKELSGAEGTLMSIPQEIHNEHPVYEAEEIREFDISTSLLNMSMSQPEHVLQHKEARKYR